MEDNKTMVGQAAPEQIEAWKKRHGSIYTATAENHIAYFRKPTRKELSYAMRLQDDSLAMTETVLKQCYLGGSTVFYEEVEFMLGAAGLIEKLVVAKKAEVGEL